MKSNAPTIIKDTEDLKQGAFSNISLLVATTKFVRIKIVKLDILNPVNLGMSAHSTRRKFVHLSTMRTMESLKELKDRFLSLRLRYLDYGLKYLTLRK